MQTPKRLRREMRQLAAKAEEAELRTALQPLANDFKRWENGDIDSFDLKALIHDFHQGLAREIYLRYDTPDPEFLVANAVASGMLNSETISPAIMAELEPLIARWKALRTESDHGTMDVTEPNGSA